MVFDSYKQIIRKIYMSEKEINSLDKSEEKNKSYPILPLRNTVLFPHQVIPVYIGRDQSLSLIDELPKNGKKTIVVVAQRDGSVEHPEKADLYDWGTLAVVMKVFDIPDKAKSAIIQGISRVKIKKVVQNKPFFKGTVSRGRDIIDSKIELEALTTNLKAIYQKLIEIAPYLTEEQADGILRIENPAKFADRSISIMNIPTEEKQTVLECLDLEDRLEKCTELVNREIQRIELSDKIQSDVQDEISKTQREYFLREQMKAIRKELGEDEASLENKDVAKLIKEANMPKDVEKVAFKELERLQRIPTSSPEYTVARTYLDWLIELPWSNSSEDNENITNAKNILDRDHFGLERVKDRILEHLAVRSLKKSRAKKGDILKAPILCFGGPPGTGKTSIGKSIAECMGREFIRISLGGVRDEAEIRGHRRTYIGALPGRIISGLKKAGTRNPIFMLDEIDKLGRDFRGDPSSALLEVLDPEQNYAFNDHYLEVDFNLSEIIFVTTANRIDQIPGPLRDRMEVLEFNGYIMSEKVAIAREYLVSKQIKEHGLKKSEIKFSDKSLEELIQYYTREAGVRNLERQVANVCRKVAKEIAVKERASVKISPKKVNQYLGPRKFYPEINERVDKPGIVVGLAWTAFGGDVLFIEASKMPGKGNLKLTGQLGDVMKESAQAAFSYVRSKAKELKIETDFYKNYDLHVHVPAGAIPKDGPSAGITMVCSLVSILLNKPLKKSFAMTGEISLRGNVMPIGGLKEKVTAAHRAGIKHIIAPFLNKKDLEDVPTHVQSDLKFSFVKDIEEVLNLVLDLSLK